MSDLFKGIWIVGSLVAAMFFTIKADDIADPWAAILVIVSVISFIGAIFYTGRKKSVGK